MAILSCLFLSMYASHFTGWLQDVNLFFFYSVVVILFRFFLKSVNRAIIFIFPAALDSSDSKQFLFTFYPYFTPYANPEGDIITYKKDLKICFKPCSFRLSVHFPHFKNSSGILFIICLG